MRLAALAGGLAVVLLSGCGRKERSEKGPAPAPTAERSTQPQPPLDPLRARDDLPPEARAILVVDGEERIVEADAARNAGYTIVDLSNSWTPFIFAVHHGEDGQPLPNRYRRVFIGLANDRLDDDGQPLEKGEKNYLELYGIPPSLSVLRARFMEDKERDCDREIDGEALAGVKHIPHRDDEEANRRRWKRRRMIEDMKEEERKRDKEQWKIDRMRSWVDRYDAEQAAIAEAEKRLLCEGFELPKRKHRRGVYDYWMVVAARQFQHKHKIYESSYRLRRTLQAMSQPLLQNDYESLVRALAERVVSAAAILEDGSVKNTKNLVDEYTEAALDQLGLTSAEAALAFFERHPTEDFEWLRAAVMLPPRPEYYSPHMDLRIVIDPGDVWYEPRFRADGRLAAPPRREFPSFTVIARHAGRLLRLVRWRTTVGGWRSEQAADGYEYYRYKGSDIGPRIIRRVISGPVWIAPESTPIRTLVKKKTVGRTRQRVVEYDQIGPGYRSAYGLVAGYFVIPGRNGRPDWDKGIRAHGSAEYLSMYSHSGYSHGCHRLPNHLAIRVYSFILQHRAMRPLGDQPMRHNRQFLWKDEVYELRIPSRGFVFHLEPPLPVEVLEGDIKGDLEEPILEYVPKPGVEYPGPPPPVPDSPEARAGAGGAAENGEEEGTE